MSGATVEQLSETELIRWVEGLLDDPAHRENPLLEPLGRLCELSRAQQTRMERLISISDGFHRISRDDHESLAERYDRHLRRMEKMARISDRYQNSLRELSVALKEAALKDPLTGLGNRRYLIERMQEEAERASRQEKPFSLGILDVDRFKSVNDRFGHEGGDRLLCDIAAAIRGSLRQYDLCGRWGGEEFLIIFPETAAGDAVGMAERIRTAIRAMSPAVPLPGDSAEGLRITASLGVSTHRPGECYDETLNRADAALFRAKSEGRDQVRQG